MTIKNKSSFKIVSGLKLSIPFILYYYKKLPQVGESASGFRVGIGGLW